MGETFRPIEAQLLEHILATIFFTRQEVLVKIHVY